MNLLYKSTRGSANKVTASQAILKGLADDGGLYVPCEIPRMEKTLQELRNMSYQEIAYEVLRLYYTDFTEAELKDCINNAYDDKFDHEEIAPIVQVGKDHYLELFHGKTIAFKDMALSILPHLLTTSAKKNQIKEEIVILTATSGDTGKAALAGFADVEGIRIVVFYPKDGVSPIQEKQMITQQGTNTFVVAIKGNFDQAQTGVKNIFLDKDLELEMQTAGYRFSSANSISIGRLFPQVAYYFYAYAQLLQKGELQENEQLNVVVPTGNFGNILSAYYAKRMGLPIGKLICASNENKVLFDFFRTGSYDKNREFKLTSSPSMDILISSNLERLIYHIAKDDADENRELMEKLNSVGKYSITAAMQAELVSFYGNYADEQDTFATIKTVFQETKYVLDPHTAVAKAVYEKYKQEAEDTNKAIVISTASPYKFPGSVLAAIDDKYKKSDDFESVDILNRLSGVAIPNAISEIKDAEIVHKTVCEVDEMKNIVKRFLAM